MLGGLSRFLSGDLGYNGALIGIMLIILGILIILAVNGLSKRKKE
jgi:hypothetical protein